MPKGNPASKEKNAKTRKNHQAVFFTNPSQTVFESNVLVEARREMTALQEKIMALIVSQIEPGDAPGQPYIISLSEVAAQIGYNSHETRNIVEAIDGLQQKLVRIKLPNKWVASFSVFQKVLYNTDGIVQVLIDPDLIPHVLELKADFTKYDRDLLYSFKSVYSIKMYKLICRYAFKQTWRLLFSDLLEMLDCPEEYRKDYHSFRLRVIKPAQKEFAEKNIQIKCTEIRVGRRVNELEFSLQSDILNGMPVKDWIKLNLPSNVTVIESVKSLHGEHDFPAHWLSILRGKCMFDDTQLEQLKRVDQTKLGRSLQKVEIMLLDQHIRQPEIYFWNHYKKLFPELF